MDSLEEKIKALIREIECDQDIAFNGGVIAALEVVQKEKAKQSRKVSNP